MKEEFNDTEFGTVPDKFRGYAVYTITLFGGTMYTFTALSDKVAIAALMRAAPVVSLYCISTPIDCIQVPKIDTDFNEIFGGVAGFISFSKQYRDCIIVTLDSMLPGTVLDRNGYNEYIQPYQLPAAKTRARLKWVQQHASYEFAKECHKLAWQMRAAKK